MQLAAYLHTGTGAAPHEYTRLRMCRDVYHCTPVELRKVPLRDVVTDLAMLGIEAKVEKARANKQAKTPGRRSRRR